MTTLRVGVAGCGSVAFNTYLRGLAHLKPKVEVVAVCDRLGERARRAQEITGAREVYEEYEAMLERAEIDAVVNLFPMPMHYETNLAALEAGKHLYSEKPMASSLAEADHLIRVAGERRVAFVCAPPMTLTPDYRAARRLIQQGVVGPVGYARAQASSPGPARSFRFNSDPTPYYDARGAGPVFDLGVYALHSLTGILGPVRRVSAMSALHLREIEVLAGPAAGKRIRPTADDVTVLLLDFGGGVLCLLDATFHMVNGEDDPVIEFYGSEGTVVLSTWYPWDRLKIYRREERYRTAGWVRPTLNDAERKDVSRWAQVYLTMGVDHLADCVLTGVPPAAGSDHARHVMEIILRGYEAARQGRTVPVESTFRLPELPGDTA